MARLQEKLGRKIQTLRKAAGLTQLELADKVGTYYKYLSYIESGRKNISTEMVERIAKALGVEPYELFVYDKPGRGESAPAEEKALRKLLLGVDPKVRSIALELMQSLLRWSRARQH